MSDYKLLKVILPFLKPYWWQMMVFVILVPISAFTYSVQPIILQRAVDGPLSQLNLNGLWIYVYALMAAVFLNFVVQVLQFWFVNFIGQNIVFNIRAKLFEHLESLSISFFDKTPVGRSVSRLTSDVEQLSESLTGGLVLVILDVFNILGILIFMFYLNVKLSFVVSAFLIPIFFIAVHYQKKFRKSNLRAREELSKLNSFLQQNIVGISVVHVLNSSKKSMEKFSKNNHAYFTANDESIKADSQLSAIVELISFIAIACFIYISAKLIGGTGEVGSFISIGVVLAFLQYAQSLFEPIRNLSDRFTIIQSAFTAAERINELLEEKSEIEEVSESKALLPLARDGKDPLVEFKNVCFKYPGARNEWVLKDLSFTLECGQKIAIVGRTGSGKSTIIKLLTRLYDPNKGEIKINGINLKEYSLKELRENLVSIHQDSYIFAGDVKENITLNRAEERLNFDFVEPLLELTTLDKDVLLSERAGNISAGEEQVINFARALVTKPEFVILDEATAKIDMKTEAMIQKIMKVFLADRTAIVIAHRLETIKNLDLILLVDHGAVVEKGSHQELLDLGTLYAGLVQESTSAE